MKIAKKTMFHISANAKSDIYKIDKYPSIIEVDSIYDHLFSKKFE